MPEPQEQSKKPWEKFAAPVQTAGPWDKYKGAGTTAKPAQAPAAPKVDADKLGQNIKEAYAKLAPEERGGGRFGQGVERAFGIDPQKMIEAFKGKDIESKGGQKSHLTGAAAQWAEFGEQFSEGLRSFGLSFLKDPLTAAQLIEAPARTLESGAKKIAGGDVAGGGGEMFGAIGQILGGAEGVKKLHAHSTVVDGGIKAASDIAKATGKEVGEAASTAHKLASEGTPSRIFKRRVFEDAYVHSKGLEIAKKIDKAAKSVHEEVKTHAQGIAEQIDTKIPTGVVDAGAEAATIMKEFQDVVKTPEKAHPVLVQMVKDAQATAPKLWSWEKARQFRSSVGRAMSGDKVVGPQKVVLTKVYVDLTKKLGGAAKQYGLEKSWNQYNELASKMDKEFSDITDGITDAKSGQEVAQKLSKDVALTSELSKNLSKYGLKAPEVLSFVQTAKRIAAAKNFMNRSLFRLVYGSPPGLATAMSLRMSGAPYIAALGGGALVGLTTSYLVSLARVLKLSPDIIEHMMKERELPGKMKFEPGTFPAEEGGAPQLEGGPTPEDPQALRKPQEETQIEMDRRLGAKGPAKSMPEQVEDARAKLKADAETKRLEWEKKQKTPLVRHPSKEPSPTKSVTPEGQVVPEVKKAAEGEHGTGKLAEQSKARERITKNRGKARREKQAIETEATARAQATHMDVSQLQIPEMEEYLRTKNPTALKGLTKMRKLGTLDVEYIEALKYLIIEDLEK
jgi:hypothetical protein